MSCSILIRSQRLFDLRLTIGIRHLLLHHPTHSLEGVLYLGCDLPRKPRIRSQFKRGFEGGLALFLFPKVIQSNTFVEEQLNILVIFKRHLARNPDFIEYALVIGIFICLFNINRRALTTLTVEAANLAHHILPHGLKHRLDLGRNLHGQFRRGVHIEGELEGFYGFGLFTHLAQNDSLIEREGNIIQRLMRSLLGHMNLLERMLIIEILIQTADLCNRLLNRPFIRGARDNRSEQKQNP
ncbi:hypothetical protein DAT35_21220 [Vitiosangium sp. GDMCC 1.1324]|nr:hypothetical protein DAT35_21220 [Vitiosangium sp. GDMCC 1.1324]